MESLSVGKKVNREGVEPVTPPLHKACPENKENIYTLESKTSLTSKLLFVSWNISSVNANVGK